MKFHTMTKSSSNQQGLQFHYLRRNTHHARQLVVLELELTGHGEDILCGTEAVCFGDANGKPNKTEEEVQHHEEYRKPEKQRI